GRYALVSEGRAADRGAPLVARPGCARAPRGRISLDAGTGRAAERPRITGADLRPARHVVEKLMRSGTPTGLVVFSDVAYELLPPGTPVRELQPLLRLLTPEGGHLPRNPWNTSFTAGTRISTALDLARRMLRRDHVKDGSILLVSDLETAPTDFEDLGHVSSRLPPPHTPAPLPRPPS